MQNRGNPQFFPALSLFTSHIRRSVVLFANFFKQPMNAHHFALNLVQGPGEKTNQFRQGKDRAKGSAAWESCYRFSCSFWERLFKEAHPCEYSHRHSILPGRMAEQVQKRKSESWLGHQAQSYQGAAFRGDTGAQLLSCDVRSTRRSPVFLSTPFLSLMQGLKSFELQHVLSMHC